MSTDTVQTSFKPPLERSKEILKRLAAQYEFDEVVLAVSGGTDSVVAADVFARLGPEFGFKPDAIVHINTGISVPQSRLVAKIIAEIHDLEFIEQGYRNPQDAIAVRVLSNGWPGDYGGSPATGGHGLEWANRKHKPMDEVYANIEGFQLWVSGARKLESKKRQGNVPDSGIEKDKPRRVWCSVIAGWTSDEKRQYIRERGLPVSEAYVFLGFSGECVACAHDNGGLLTDIDLLCPELSYCIRSVAVWLYQRVKRGEVDIAPKRLCWGWDVEDTTEPEDVEQEQLEDTITMPREEDVADEDTSARLEVPTAQSMVGCSEESCKTMDEKPTWILELPDSQLVTRDDVVNHWESGEVPTRFPLT